MNSEFYVIFYGTRYIVTSRKTKVKLTGMYKKYLDFCLYTVRGTTQGFL